MERSSVKGVLRCVGGTDCQRPPDVETDAADRPLRGEPADNSVVVDDAGHPVRVHLTDIAESEVDLQAVAEAMSPFRARRRGQPPRRKTDSWDDDFFS